MYFARLVYRLLSCQPPELNETVAAGVLETAKSLVTREGSHVYSLATVR